MDFSGWLRLHGYRRYETKERARNNLGIIFPLPPGEVRGEGGLNDQVISCTFLRLGELESPLIAIESNAGQ